MLDTENQGNRAGYTQGFEALCYQLLETELGGVQVYAMALQCVQNKDLKKEFTKYHQQTQRHVEIARAVLEQLGLDPDADVPARSPIKRIGKGLLEAMTTAKASGSADEAELCAVECVVLAETKDHENWELCSLLAKHHDGPEAAILLDACTQIEKEEDRHLYQSAGWARELWIAALGLPAAR